MMLASKRSLIFLPALVGLCIFVLNISYSSGPAYLQDEIGYLSKAALLMGKLVDGSSSYHGGVSILISPVFLLDDPSKIWIAILFVNSIVCAASIHLVLRIVDFYSAAKPALVLRCAVFLAVMHPSIWVMSGYIFPSIYLGLFFLLVIWTFLQGEERVGWVALSALLVGFMYWMHPTGLAVCIAFMLARIVMYSRGDCKSTWKLLALQLIIVCLMLIIYKLWVHPSMNMFMTPVGQPINSHYGDFREQIEKITSVAGFLGLIRSVLGQLSYLVISTFGLGFLGLIYLFSTSWDLIYKGGDRIKGGVNFFILLSLLGLLAMGAVAMTALDRIDHIIYGRYQEYTYTLLIVFGFFYIAEKHNKDDFWGALRFSAIIISIILIMGIWIIYPSVSSVGMNNNIINTIGMYPQYIFKETDLPLWLAFGLCGVLFLLFVGPWSYIPAMIIMSIIAIFNQVAWHKSILVGHSKPSALALLVTENVKPRGCIAFDVDGMNGEGLSLRQKEQFNIFKFYFSNYQYKRMSFASWFDNCDGPLLTYSPEKYIGNENIIVRARDADLRLFLISRSLDNNWGGDNIPGIVFNKGNNLACFFGGCFEMLSNQLLKFSQNGMMRDDYLVEDVNKTGSYLFFGPYSTLSDGAWRIDLELERFTEGEYVLDVVSEGGKVKHVEKNIKPGDFGDGIISLPFDLIQDVNSLEIRLRVVKAGNISVKKYAITSQ